MPLFNSPPVVPGKALTANLNMTTFNPDPATFVFCLLSIVIVIFVSLLSLAVRIVPEYQRLVVFRLGRFIGVRGPGLVLAMPVIDLTRLVDLREQTRRLKAHVIPVRDNTRLAVDAAWTFQVVDPAQVVLGVANVETAMRDKIASELASTLGTLAASAILSNRRQIELDVLTELRPAGKTWGIEVKTLTIQDARQV